MEGDELKEGGAANGELREGAKCKRRGAGPKEAINL